MYISFLILAFMASVSLIPVAGTGYSGLTARRITIRGRGSSSTYVEGDMPYYESIDVPDVNFCVPSIGSITRSIYYTNNWLNDTLLVKLGGDYLLAVLRGVNRTHASFDIYLVDMTTGSYRYLGNLYDYGIVFPKTFYHSIIYYAGYPVGRGELVLAVYHFSSRHGLTLNLYDIILNEGIRVRDRRSIANISYYAGLPSLDEYFAVKHEANNTVTIIHSRDPMLRQNNTIHTNITYPSIPYTAQITHRLTRGILWISMDDVSCLGYGAGYSRRILIFGVDMDDWSLGYAYTYREESWGARDFYSKFSRPFVIGHTLYYPTTNRILYHSLQASPTGNLSIYLNTTLPPGSAFVRPAYPYIYLLRYINVPGNPDSGLSNISVYDFSNPRGSIGVYPVRNRVNATLYVDPLSPYYKRLPNDTSVLIIPYYTYRVCDGTVNYGFEYIVLQGGRVVNNMLLSLDGFNEWDVYNGTMINEIEAYTGDVDGDGFEETIGIHKAYFINQTYEVDIYIIDDQDIAKINPAPEPWIIIVILPAVIMALLVWRGQRERNRY